MVSPHWSWRWGCALLTLGCIGGPYGAATTADAFAAPGEDTPIASKGDTSPTDQTDTIAATPQDSVNGTMVPAGFGSMRQDALSLHVDGPGILIRVLPLDESIIRLLTPDSYRSMRDLKQSHQKAADAIARRFGARHVSLWLVSFYGVQPDAQFVPMDLTITSGGRDFRPYDLIALTTGFGEQRLRQRETQSAVYVFDGDIQLNQPVILTYQNTKDETWETTLQQIERERALIRARASKSQQ
jgi:hypothetical protein